MTARRDLNLHEGSRIPPMDAFLAYGAMLPFPAAFVVALAAPFLAGAAVLGAQLWGAALLLFFSGVRRGLSFRTPGGATGPQMAAFAGLFSAGFVALLLPAAWALPLILVALLLMAAIDPVAARRAEAPLYFERLRPPQLAVGVAGLAGLTAMVVLF
ncbi:hypothetical protein [Citreimonas salinaria]|uniref:DUF3429 domain-containing protein n=1 Tax=Citreimonas salinaria TaxID=321339 RepID=A0A1H3FXS3_9RHOB|nr:hypothetical protein [Citreimonas salinaria]SDX95872.1 hypothetical protein SAMN05444340_10241 [Citreimonas salinaria]